MRLLFWHRCRRDGEVRINLYSHANDQRMDVGREKRRRKTPSANRRTNRRTEGNDGRKIRKQVALCRARWLSTGRSICRGEITTIGRHCQGLPRDLSARKCSATQSYQVQLGSIVVRLMCSPNPNYSRISRTRIGYRTA